MADLHRYDVRQQGKSVLPNIQAQNVTQARTYAEEDVSTTFGDLDFVQATTVTLIATGTGTPQLNQYEVTVLWRRNVIISATDKTNARDEAMLDSAGPEVSEIQLQSVRFLKEKVGVTI